MLYPLVTRKAYTTCLPNQFTLGCNQAIECYSNEMSLGSFFCDCHNKSCLEGLLWNGSMQQKQTIILAAFAKESMMNVCIYIWWGRPSKMQPLDKCHAISMRSPQALLFVMVINNAPLGLKAFRGLVVWAVLGILLSGEPVHINFLESPSQMFHSDVDAVHCVTGLSEQ